jgi:VWFA-related protein
MLCVASVVGAQPSSAPALGQKTSDQSHPELSHRPSPRPGTPTGKIQLDVLVTDGAGRPVTGLQQQDFTLLDNKKPQPILSFRAVDGSTGQLAGAGNGRTADPADPPVEVILLLDATNNSLTRVAYERTEIERFLRQNGGHLEQPLSLMIFSERGVKVQPQPTTDGNQVAQVLNKAEATMHVVQRSGGYDAIERVELSLKTLRSIVAVEASKPGRKMLIWIGPGWPMLEGPGYRASDATKRALFNTIVDTSRTLREARITMYGVNSFDPQSPGMMRADFYKSFLKGVPSARQVESGDLAVPVFAIHSGGRVLDRAEDLVDQLNSCVAEAKSYYTIGFDPPSAEHVDEYHDLELKVDKPNVKVRTNAGYYSEPLAKP